MKPWGGFTDGSITKQGWKDGTKRDGRPPGSHQGLGAAQDIPRRGDRRGDQNQRVHVQEQRDRPAREPGQPRCEHEPQEQREEEDLESDSGTFLNGKRIQRAVLRDGDQIGMGAIQFSFRLHQTNTSATRES